MGILFAMKDIPLYTQSSEELGKGQLVSPKRMNFRKSSKWPLTRPPHFQKNHVPFFFQFHAQKALFKGPKSAT